MRFLVLLAVLGGALELAPRPAAVREALDGVQARQQLVVDRLVCERRATSALLTEDPAALAEAERICAAVWGPAPGS